MSRRFRTCSGRSTLSEPDRLQNEFERALHHPIPYRRNPEQADLPTVVRKLDLARSRTPTAFRGPPGYAGSGACPWLATRPTTNVYTRIIWLRRPEQDATPGVIRRPGAPRLAFALAVALIRHAV